MRLISPSAHQPLGFEEVPVPLLPRKLQHVLPNDLNYEKDSAMQLSTGMYRRPAQL